jgi:nucleotide-binding universal stress UspA family protein
MLPERAGKAILREKTVMKSLLVPVEEHTLLGPVMETAILLGHQFDSYIEGIPISPNVPAFLAAEAAIGDTSFLHPAVRRDRAQSSQLHFETFMQARGVSPAALATTGLSFGWHGGDPVEDDAMGSYARTFDITVVGRPSEIGDHPRIATTEAALFESGRPVLIAPPAVPRTLGGNVGIAWNRSTETARAVALAMPLLATARQITIIEIDEWGTSGPSGEDLARSLGRHGVKVATRTFPDPHRRPGGAILAAASTIECDLLIKGAYTQSRLRQMIFGGATNHILENTTLPVLMAH